MKNEKDAGRKTCESCGAEFSCGAESGGCWCFEIELKPETLAQMRDDFESCLCRDCLAKKNNDEFRLNRIEENRSC